jgi:predicted DNA-binding protein YlxM (UPF0122 family)
MGNRSDRQSGGNLTDALEGDLSHGSAGAFIADWLHDDWTMTELAERYQISRKTAYKWVERYESLQPSAFSTQNRLMAES